MKESCREIKQGETDAPINDTCHSTDSQYHIISQRDSSIVDWPAEIPSAILHNPTMASG